MILNVFFYFFFVVLQQHRGAQLELKQLAINVAHIGWIVEVASTTTYGIESIDCLFNLLKYFMFTS